MDKKSKLLLLSIIIISLLSISAAFYKSVVLQEFVITGMGVYLEEDYTYSWFVYEGEEYEFETESTDYADLEQAVVEELGAVDGEFLADLEATFTEAEEELESEM